MKLEKGTKVKCITNTYDGFKPTTKMAVAFPYLTVGKTYNVLADFGPTLAIITDNGQGHSLLKDLFITLDEYRQNQIKELGI
jgi:hypothetical protein